jgi:hypothetical protein
LITEQIEDQHHTRLGFADRVGQVRFVGFKQTDSRARTAQQIGIRDRRGRQAGDQVGSGAVMQYALAACPQNRSQHARGGGFAVGAADQHHTLRQQRGQIVQHARRDPPRHHARHLRAAADAQPPAQRQRQLARRRRYDSTHRVWMWYSIHEGRL